MKTKYSKVLTLFLAFVVQISFAQDRKISGTVTDDSGLPLPGVNVLKKGSSSGTQTDFDGKYSISVATGEQLIFSYLGFLNKKVTASIAAIIDVQLEQDTAELDEVVVTAYGTQKSTNLTSATSVVKAEEIEQVPIASLDQVLQGRVAGANISVGSGQPGQSGNIQIRGRTSILGNVEPLFIIDGVPVDGDNFRSLNSNDIESLTVLKDASASALYGNRAAAGVIVITTKKGSFSSPLEVSYRGQYGISKLPKANFEVMDSFQFLTFQKELGAGLGNTLTDQEILELSNRVDADWADVFGQDGQTISHEINISGGSENLRSYTSFGYFNQEGTTLGSELQRFTFRANNNFNKDRVDIQSNFTANFSRSSYIIDGIRGNNTGGELDNPFLVAYLGLPYQDPFNADGSLNLVGDGTEGFLNLPYLALNQVRFNEDIEEEVKVVGNVKGSYEIIKNLKVGGTFGMDYQQINFLSTINPLSLRGQSVPTAESEIKGSRTDSQERDVAFNINSQISYKNEFNEKHTIEASAFTEYYKRHRRFLGVTGFGIQEKLINSIQGITDGNTVEGEDVRPYIPNQFGFSDDRGLFSVFGLFRYGFEKKYGFEASIRRDAASRFSTTNRWGTFYSFSGRWNVNQEEFLANADWLNSLKLRASYGLTGNQALGTGNASLFAAFDLYSINTGYNGTPGLFPDQIGNPNLTWEKTTQFNIGIDLTAFNNRLSTSIDFYNKITDDLFLSRPLSLTSGFQTLNSNVGEMRNRGVELQFSYDIIDKKDYSVNFNFNGAYNQNEILGLAGAEQIPDGQRIQAVGKPYGSYFLVRWAGVNPDDGSPIYLDKDGNETGQFSDDDRVVLDKSSEPVWTGGFGLNFTYKNFAISSLFSFALDYYRVNGSLGVIEDTGLAGFANQSTTLLDRWRNPGDITDIPAAGFNTRLQANDRYLEDASFLRLRNIQLSYTLFGSQLSKNPKFKSVRLYLQGQNLITWTKWRGFDPESTERTFSGFFDFPTPTTLTMGVDINL